VNDAVLDAIRTRRVVRALTDAPVGHDQLRTILDSARYAPHAGNRRLHRYVVSLGMHRVGSPYLVSLVFILLTIVGAVLALLAPDVQGSSISGSLLVYEPVGS
jgi:hypothetical protein